MKRLLEFCGLSGPATAILCVHVLLLVACGAFVAHFDPVSHDHLTSLKTFHLKFIDDFTAEQGKEWDEGEFQLACDQGETMFTQALDYELNKDKRDKNREAAISNLHEQFKADCDFLEAKAIEGAYFFSPTYAGELKETVEENYDLAIEGEEKRRGGPKS